jgi:transaldolase
MNLNISSKILLDGADPRESKEAKNILGFLDGQTTNPTLLTKHPEARHLADRGEKFLKEEIYYFYKRVVKEIAEITSGPISIEVYADEDTSSEKMVEQAEEMARWVPNACIKLPITKEGLIAAKELVQKRISLNMTLCFSQEQAAAVYVATKESEVPVFVSPFVGRLDDRNENGMDLVENILKMYQKGDGHVFPLVASVRSLDHLLYAIKISSPFITVPLEALKQWHESDFKLPDDNFSYNPDLEKIPYKEIDLNNEWENYDIFHPLTGKGLKKFADDWNSVIK